MLDLDLCCDLAAPAIVREAMAELEGGGWMIGDAMLVASELVTNAVVHSGGTEADRIRVRVTHEAGAVCISVWDPGASGRDAHLSSGAHPLLGGYGLHVVDAIAARWGAERGDGYHVWAELSVGEQTV